MKFEQYNWIAIAILTYMFMWNNIYNKETYTCIIWLFSFESHNELTLTHNQLYLYCICYVIMKI